MLLTAIPYAVLKVDRGIRSVLRGFGGVPLLIVLLVVGASVPLLIEGARQQPLNQTVSSLRGGTSALATWVRMKGRIVPLGSPSGTQDLSLLIEPNGDAILLISTTPIDDLTMITGHLGTSSGVGDMVRRVDPPGLPDNLNVLDGYHVKVDDQIVPEEQRSWIEAWLPLGLAGLLLVGYLLGYPLLTRDRRRGAATAEPLAVGESVAVRVVDRDAELGVRSAAQPGRFKRLERRAESDPHFAVTMDGVSGSVHLYRHTWSWERPGTLWFVAERQRVLQVHDWGLELILAFASDADRDRVRASLAATPPQSSVGAPARA
jgi:hypothetical protein